MKRHKIPASRLVAIPHALTPMLPEPGQFTRYTTPLPPADWNVPTLRMVARHCLCDATRDAAARELLARGEA